MPWKRTTFLVFPQDPEAGRTRSYSIPKVVPWLIGLVLILAVTGLTCYSIDTHRKYIKAKNYRFMEPELTRLRNKAATQDLQLFALADKFQRLELELGRLQQYNRKLRAMSGSGSLGLENGLESMTVTPTEGGVGGPDIERIQPRLRLRQDARDLIRQVHRDVDRLLAEAGVHEMDQHQIGRFLLDSKALIAATPNNWPLKGRITSFFGYRTSPFGGRRREFHKGLDISRPTGTPIVSPADGFVVSYKKMSGYGNLLTVNHGYGLVTRYGHLSRSYVKPGDRVRCGQKIAAVGATGRVTGPHLHYEVVDNGVHINPMKYLVADK